MEPLRGGNLAAKAPEKVQAKFNSYKEKRSPAFWALRWLWNQEGIGVVLSGMNVDEHIVENIKVANLTAAGSMSDEESRIVEEVKVIYRDLMQVPCTGCNYCMPCPFGVDIPGIFSDYNEKYFFGGRMAQIRYISKQVGIMGEGNSGATLCTECGLCERHCPQSIEIRKELKNAHGELDNSFIRTGLSIGMRIMGRKPTKKAK